MHCSRRLTVQTLAFSRSYLHRQVSPPETLVVKGGTTWARNDRWILSKNVRLPRNIQGFLHAVNLRHGTNGFASLPKEGVLRVFLSLKNPTASAGYESANLCTKGQHATSRPPKPLAMIWETFVNCVRKFQELWPKNRKCHHLLKVRSKKVTAYA